MLQASALTTNNYCFPQYYNNYYELPLAQVKDVNLVRNPLSLFVVVLVDEGARCMSSSSGFFTKETVNTIDLFNIDVNTDFTSPKEQINDLRKYMGFNISELANIIKVKRPTIYEWLEGKSPSPKNQAKLDLIYSFCKRWKEIGAGRLGRYMYRNVTQDNKCLMDLLEAENINETQVHEVLDVIAASLSKPIKERAAREEILKSEGFEPISKGEQRSRLMKLTRKIS